MYKHCIKFLHKIKVSCIGLENQRKTTWRLTKEINHEYFYSEKQEKIPLLIIHKDGGKENLIEKKKWRRITSLCHHAIFLRKVSKGQRPDDLALLNHFCQLHEGWDTRDRDRGASLHIPGPLVSKCVNARWRAQASSMKSIVTEIQIVPMGRVQGI